MTPPNGRFSSRFSLAVLTMLILGIVGCGPRVAKIYPVDGKVVYKDGAPVSGGIIEFDAPDSDPGGPIKPNARAAIQEDGAFRMTTLVDGDGSVAGRHRVVIIPPIDIDSGPPGSSAKPLLPKKYRSYDTSELSVEVAEQENHITIAVDREKQGKR